MTLPLDIGEQLIDRQKSSLFLYYLARSSKKVQERELRKRKVQIAIKQLKKLSTKHLHEHIDQLETHVATALDKESQILDRQKQEDLLHGDLKKKIVKLEGKLTKYMDTQDQRKERIQELEDKIKQKFEVKKEKVKTLKEDYKNLLKLYKQAKKSKVNKERLLSIANRLTELKTKIVFVQ